MTQRELQILAQPSDTSCGPTCLHALYNYYGDSIQLPDILNEIDELETGGTLAVHLAIHALQRGYAARIYTYNLQLFDPTWFENDGEFLAAKLIAQRDAKADRRRLHDATGSYLQFLELGGKVSFEDLSLPLIRRHLDHGRPLLTGLSSTYLYRSAREVGRDADYDDVAGDPGGHFVVLHRFRPDSEEILVSDPFAANPLSKRLNYAVGADRLIGAILLGIVTYDANLLLIEPK